MTTTPSSSAAAPWPPSWSPPQCGSSSTFGSRPRWAAGVLDDAQAALLAEATERRDSRTVDVSTIAEAAEAAATGWARIPWAALGTEGEAELAKDSVTVRCLVMPDGSLPSGDDAEGVLAVVARAY